MKFPRNTRLLRSPFEIAPFAAVFFLLVIFMMLGALLPTPGISLQPPTANDLPGIDKPSVAVAVDSSGRFYFANEIVTEAQLKSDLGKAAKNSRAPLTLVVHTDKSVTYEQLV
ncbi:MAG TPA: biopolymer transporter ExbD, partial [Dongiaceae bacterium]|nr:biopolymer transporter ExbD [Dongiaceae bacterium]